MTREEILNEWEKDGPISPIALESASINTVRLQTKYLRIRSDERLVLQKLEDDYKVHWLDRFEWFVAGESNDSKAAGVKFPPSGKPLAKEREKHIDIDEKVRLANLRLVVQKEKLAVLDEILKILAARNFAISNIIKLRQLEAGQ